jgi:hypothetical protein
MMNGFKWGRGPGGGRGATELGLGDGRNVSCLLKIVQFGVLICKFILKTITIKN